MALSSVDLKLLTGVVSLLTIGWLAYRAFLSPLKNIPGPFLACFSDGWRAYLTWRGNVDEHQREWHRKWGCAVRVGPNAVSLNDPDLLKVVYTSKNRWRKSDMYRPNDVVVNGHRIQNVFNTQDEGFHAAFGKPMAPLWTLKSILELEWRVDQTLDHLVQRLSAEFVDGKGAGATVPLDQWLSYFAWDATANVSFGDYYGFIEQGKDVGGILAESEAGLKYFAPVSQMPVLDEWLDKNPIWRLGPRPLVNGFNYTIKLVTNYQKGVANGDIKPHEADHFLRRYNSLRDTHPVVTDDQVIRYMMLNILGGGDSTAGAMRAAMYHLAKNTDKRDKMLAEFEHANLAVPAQWKDVCKLTYFDAVMKESMRVSPSLGLILEREVPQGGFELPDGRFIPEGTKVGMNPAVITRDADTFGARLGEFVPERWLRGQHESAEAFAARYSRMSQVTNFMFGSGPRVCMGQHLAKMEMYKVVATLHRTFDIRLIDGGHEWKYFNAWFMYPTGIPVTMTRWA